MTEKFCSKIQRANENAAKKSLSKSTIPNLSITLLKN
jgi:hypothetical protein